MKIIFKVIFTLYWLCVCFKMIIFYSKPPTHQKVYLFGYLLCKSSCIVRLSRKSHKVEYTYDTVFAMIPLSYNHLCLFFFFLDHIIIGLTLVDDSDNQPRSTRRQKLQECEIRTLQLARIVLESLKTPPHDSMQVAEMKWVPLRTAFLLVISSTKNCMLWGYLRVCVFTRIFSVTFRNNTHPCLSIMSQTVA